MSDKARDIAVSLSSFLPSTRETLGQITWSQWLVYSITLTAFYALGRCTYLLFFHPLAGFPGPRLAAISNVWYGYHWLTGKYPWAIENAFKKYGDVVRIAPNELAFMTPEASKDIYGGAVRNRETFIKTNFQEIGESEPGITAERDPDKHREISKKLLPAFSGKALRAQESVVHGHVDRFIRQLEREVKVAEALEMRKWFDWLVFDLAGDMAYNREFNQVRDKKPSLFLSTFLRVGLWGTINQVSRRFPLLRPMIWFLVPPSVVLTVPTLLRLNREETRRRLNQRENVKHADYFGQLLPVNGPDPTEDFLLAQANVFIVAGFDPMTNLLSSALYFMLTNSATLKRLTEEVREAFKEYGTITNDQLQRLKYLQGVMDEALRLHTNAAFGLPRVSPGAKVDRWYIPKGTTVQTCFFATTHSNRYFTSARSFHPERWLPQTHRYYDPGFSADNKSAFSPFSLGPRGCPGMNAGYMQARIVLAKLLWQFDVELVNGDQVDWERDLRMWAIWQRPEIWVKFRPVERGREADA